MRIPAHGMGRSARETRAHSAARPASVWLAAAFAALLIWVGARAESPRSGVNRAPDAVFLPTPQEIVEEMLKIAHVQKTDRVVDLGSGDGRFVITAAKEYGARAVGYEIDAKLVQQSRRTIAQEAVESLARIEHADLFTVDLKDADVVTVFLYPRLMERLIPQFEKLKPGSRIVSHQFDLPGVAPNGTWEISCKEDGERHRVLLWTTPLRRQN